MKFLKYASVAGSLFVGTLCLAQDSTLKPETAQVQHAFRDEAGNYIVRFKYFSVGMGVNDAFWGPKEGGVLYQLQEEGFKGNRDVYEMKILAPGASNAERTASIRVTPDGKLIVVCEGGYACFRRISESEERSLETAVRVGTVRLEALPQVFTVAHVFKIAGTETYIVLDRPELNRSSDYRVFMGEKGKMQRVDVARVEIFRDGGTAYVELVDGRTIYSPSPYISKPAMLITREGVEQGLEVLKPTVAQAAALGLDVKAYDMMELRTPVSGAGRCELAFGY